MLPIFVVNNFGQFNHLILRMFRDLAIDARMIPNSLPPDDVAEGCRGLVLGGGPEITRAGNSPGVPAPRAPGSGDLPGPSHHCEGVRGERATGKVGGYGPVDVEVQDHDAILAGYPDRIRVWASHADEVARVPPGFRILAGSSICAHEAIALPELRIFGLQWHPEVSHTADGRRVYENFNTITLEEGR